MPKGEGAVEGAGIIGAMRYIVCKTSLQTGCGKKISRVADVLRSVATCMWVPAWAANTTHMIQCDEDTRNKHDLGAGASLVNTRML